jgi:hypothetical protein
MALIAGLIGKPWLNAGKPELGFANLDAGAQLSNVEWSGG